MGITELLKSFQWSKATKIFAGVLLGWTFWFCLLVIALRWVNPPFTAFTLQENWEALHTERYSLRTQWVLSEDLPDHLKLAVIASEDQRFKSHWGIDLSAIEQAMEDNAKGRRIRGASTITQQVAKNLFLSPSQTYIRKAAEAMIAVFIDLFWTKDRIMEVYLNIAEFGPGMFGIAKASEHYYGKEPALLSPKESARMVTALPSPKRIEPVPASEYVVQRSTWILRNMQRLSGIRFLPRPNIDSLPADTIAIPVINFEELKIMQVEDTSGLYLDSILQELQADTIAY